MTFLPSEKPASLHELRKMCAALLMPRYQDMQLCSDYTWWMLEELIQKDRAFLISCITTDFLTDQQYALLDEWLSQQIIDKCPLAYLMGTVPFGDLILKVEKPLLIPRLETEHWCYELIARMRAHKKKSFRIADIGTGSGCIALALAHAFPESYVDALDIAHEALALAAYNGVKNHVTNVAYRYSDVMDALCRTDLYDMIVSNPPYISDAQWLLTDESVRLFEDPRALIAKNDGLAIVEKIIKHAEKHLKQQEDRALPRLVLEIGLPAQAHCVSDMLEKAGYRSDIWYDLSNKERVVVGY